jgi:hypothetical protein
MGESRYKGTRKVSSFAMMSLPRHGELKNQKDFSQSVETGQSK